MSQYRTSSIGSKAAKLKQIALSSKNTHSLRMRAINLLGELGEDVYDDLADVAAKGLTGTERMYALELIDKIVKGRGVESQQVIQEVKHVAKKPVVSKKKEGNSKNYKTSSTKGETAKGAQGRDIL